jgi:hypothetical protein
VLSHFEDTLDSWVPKHGLTFLYNNSIPKGQIIEILSAKLKLAEDNNKPPTLEENIKNVAKQIRNEIETMPLTFTEWPADEVSLTQNRTNLPVLLEKFMTSLLTASNQRKSKRKERIICSMVQDIIYNVTNGKHRTSKHVLLSLCVKRKTGSKQMINWLNRFGHGISYDEVKHIFLKLLNIYIKVLYHNAYKILNIYSFKQNRAERELIFNVSCSAYIIIFVFNI